MLQKLCNRYESLNCLVRKRATGSPKELAQKLGISERAWYKLRDELVNELGVPLAYCPIRRTYYYAEEGELVFRFRRKLEDEQMEELSGGFGAPTAVAHGSFVSLIRLWV
ncbi:hypothetical protein [Larkinella humicola]|uniref:HTH domain-containing protein n=1 Tax=Larkinella humicola TaxID=2607654 RepID=A0A5N1JJ27_9BACT|nr:hypothetical protein [Larkinella humicola]KAA9355162.1 hypothetical protein F0P93_11335 [Larkinella humicola]